jgi:DNA-binding ferritin-like protein (Dps family)
MTRDLQSRIGHDIADFCDLLIRKSNRNEQPREREAGNSLPANK